MKALKILIVVFFSIGVALYLFDHRNRVLAEMRLDRFYVVRVIKIAPEGRWLSDHFIYRFEFLADGRLHSCTSYSGESFEAAHAKISLGKNGAITATLDDEITYTFHEGFWGAES